VARSVERLRNSRFARLEDTASYNARVQLLKHDPHTVAAENSAAQAAAQAEEVPVSPLASELEQPASDSTELATVPGEEAYTGQSSVPTSPLDASVFRSSSTAQVAKSSRRNIKISPTKLNDLCRLVRGVGVQEALVQLKLSQKKKAHIVAGVIMAASSGAVHNHNMDRKRLYIDKLWVGHGTHLKRLDIKGRGRCGIKLRYRSHLNVELKEQGADPAQYKGIWKYGGRSHDARTGAELRIGRVGPLLTTVQRTLEHMREWRTARGMAAKVDRELLEVDRQRAVRASGVASDFDLLFGAQEQSRPVPARKVAGAKKKGEAAAVNDDFDDFDEDEDSTQEQAKA